jgi:hypothetical protein
VRNDVCVVESRVADDEGVLTLHDRGAEGKRRRRLSEELLD